MAGVIDQSNTAASTGQQALPENTNFTKYAIQFVPSSSQPITEVRLFLNKFSGSPTGNMWIEIWSDTGSNTPNAQLGTNSSILDVTTLTGTITETSFTWTNGYKPTSGTKYWIVVNSTMSPDPNNNVGIDQTTTSYQTASMHYDSESSSWVSLTDKYLRFKEYHLPFGASFLFNLV